jgi:hypothetical protein
MNTLPVEKKTLILSLLSEGNSIRSIERMSGVHRDTIMRLMVSVAERCEAFMDETMVNLTVNKLQCDEIWCFVSKKQKRVEPDENDLSPASGASFQRNRKISSHALFPLSYRRTKEKGEHLSDTHP